MTISEQNFSDIFTDNNIESSRPNKGTANDSVELERLKGPKGGDGDIEKSVESDFDPFKVLNVEHPTSYFATITHLIKGNVGGGILSLPDAFRNAGLLVGTIGTTLMGIICVHCIHMLLRCSYYISCRKQIPSLGFADTGEAAFEYGPKSLRRFGVYCKNLIRTFVCMSQLGYCCVYFVFVGTTMKEMLDPYLGEFDVRVYMSVILVPLVIMNWIRSLKFIAPFSLIANVLMVFSFSVIYYYILLDLPPIDTRNYVTTVAQVPLLFGTALFSYGSIAMMLPLQQEMGEPRKFWSLFGVLNVGMTLVGLLYVATGFLGYLRYGEDTEGTITLNLPDEPLGQAVKAAMAGSVFLSYAIQVYIPVATIWPLLKTRINDESKDVCYETVFRTAIVLFTFILAATIPHLSLFISLVGAFTVSVLAIVLPPIIEILTFWDMPHSSVTSLTLWKNIFLLVIGLFFFFSGSITSMIDIKKALYSG